MRLQNDTQHYGWVSIILHWIVALLVIILFFLGLWMVDLGYYDSWYHKAPFVHKSIGVMLIFLVPVRIAWYVASPAPEALDSHAAWISKVAKWVHRLLYLLLLLVIVSGYLISTADGRSVSWFGLVELPALFSGGERQAEIAGTIHYLLANTLLGVATLHMLAALKHHFIDKDRTLLRMLGH